MTDTQSSTGLPSRTAAALAYAGWWVTGLIVWFVERQDHAARFHAAQSVVTFGAIAAAMALLGGLAVASLSFLPSAFTTLVGAAGLAWVVGVALWLVSLWKAATGQEWRIPLAAGAAEHMARVGTQGSGPRAQDSGGAQGSGPGAQADPSEP